jgi:hypothetical protein
MMRDHAGEDIYGRKRFKLGAVELAAVVSGLGFCGWMITQWGQSITRSQGDTTKQVAALTTQMAVMNDQIGTLTTQLVNVPENTKSIARLDAQYAALELRVEKIEAQLNMHARPQ